MNFMDVLNSLTGGNFVPTVVGVVVGVVSTFLFNFIKGLLKAARPAVEASPTKVDDALLDAAETAVGSAKEEFRKTR